LATLVVTNKIWEHYNILEGSIEFGCDGLSAITTGFSSTVTLSVKTPNYDLIAAIRYQRKHSHLQWKVRHVKGHQDETQDFRLLDRWIQLNMIVDRMAKDHLSSAAGQSRLQSVAHEPWSLWVAGNKVTKNLLSTLYEWVHSPLAKEYWRAKTTVRATFYKTLTGTHYTPPW
jgi:hypothetical protein